MATDQHQVRAADTASRRDAFKLAGALTVGGAAVALTTGLPGSPVTATLALADQNGGARFSFEIDGVSVAGVTSMQGIGPESEIVEYKDGEDGTMHTRPGNLKPAKLTATRDWSNTSEWYRWRKTVIDGKTERKSISVIVYNDAGEASGRVTFSKAWPVRWELDALNAKNGGHATEQLELCWETMEIKAG